jgi:hypothetical protein
MVVLTWRWLPVDMVGIGMVVWGLNTQELRQAISEGKGRGEDNEERFLLQWGVHQ